MLVCIMAGGFLQLSLHFFMFSNISSGLLCADLFAHNSLPIQLTLAFIQCLADNALNIGFFYAHFWSFNHNLHFIKEEEVTMREAFQSMRSVRLQDFVPSQPNTN